MQYKPTLPSDSKEYAVWILSGRTATELVSHNEVDGFWILDNFVWLHECKVISNVTYENSDQLGWHVSVYIDHAYAQYSMFSGTVFSRAVELARQYYPHLFAS